MASFSLYFEIKWPFQIMALLIFYIIIFFSLKVSAAGDSMSATRRHRPLGPKTVFVCAVMGVCVSSY